jgi:hypothetical protein
MQSPIENVEELSKQTEIKYGVVRSGATENFFKVTFQYIYFKNRKFFY